MADWFLIRSEYEQGISQNTLAKRHGISQQAISKRARKEAWQVLAMMPEVVSPTTSYNQTQPDPDENIPTIEIVEKALRSLAQHLNENEDGYMDLRSHKLFADALSQYVKLKLLVAPADDNPTASGLPAELLPYATLDELAALDSIVKAIEERKLQAEQEAAGVRPLRKHS